MVRSAALERSVVGVEEQRILLLVGAATLDSGPAREALQTLAAAYQRLVGLARTEGWRFELTMIRRTDATGSRERNDLLSAQRAEAVRDAVAARGVPVDEVRIIGRGVSEPLQAADAARQSDQPERIVCDCPDTRPFAAGGDPPVVVRCFRSLLIVSMGETSGLAFNVHSRYEISGRHGGWRSVLRRLSGRGRLVFNGRAAFR